jgi:hypothetical protein
MSRDATGTETEWIGGGAAARLLACQPRRLRHLAEGGWISIRQIPGCRCRYSRADVERLARAATRPAVADALDRVAPVAACGC